MVTLDVPLRLFNLLIALVVTGLHMKDCDLLPHYE